jgi:hypothetical protein
MLLAAGLTRTRVPASLNFGSPLGRHAGWALAATTRRLGSAIVTDMASVNAHAAFRQAVLDFAEAPTPRNARRYLAASVLLEQEPTPRSRRGSKKSTGREWSSRVRSS